jgi:hypothetical protein
VVGDQNAASSARRTEQSIIRAAAVAAACPAIESGVVVFVRLGSSVRLRLNAGRDHVQLGLSRLLAGPAFLSSPVAAPPVASLLGLAY